MKDDIKNKLKAVLKKVKNIDQAKGPSKKLSSLMLLSNEISKDLSSSDEDDEDVAAFNQSQEYINYQDANVILTSPTFGDSIKIK